ncbi:MAG: hypothetical protein QM537_02785 [Candidatus Symbiobacter sp.]|nr:hypothetical protein [Candidatus Symbiobacter sp.]
MDDQNHNNLVNIAWSNIDFVLVGYAIECLTQEQRDQEIIKIQISLQYVGQRWFKDKSQIVSDWHRLLSRLQVFYRANEILQSNDDWLEVNRLYFPNIALHDHFIGRKYDSYLRV